MPSSLRLAPCCEEPKHCIQTPKLGEAAPSRLTLAINVATLLLAALAQGHVRPAQLLIGSVYDVGDMRLQRHRGESTPNCTQKDRRPDPAAAQPQLQSPAQPSSEQPEVFLLLILHGERGGESDGQRLAFQPQQR